MIQVIHTILLIVYIIVCVALTIVVLMQEGKQAGLTGAISGAAETYWGKNKGRSMEGGMVLATKVLAALFIVISLLLNLKILHKGMVYGDCLFQGFLDGQSFL